MRGKALHLPPRTRKRRITFMIMIKRGKGGTTPSSVEDETPPPPVTPVQTVNPLGAL